MVGKKTVSGLIGMRMDKRIEKGLTQKQNTMIPKKTVSGLIGMRMDKRSQKELTRKVNGFLKNVGIMMGMNVNVGAMVVVNNPHPKR